jgi:hypothetical protein
MSGYCSGKIRELWNFLGCFGWNAYFFQKNAEMRLESMSGFSLPGPKCFFSCQFLPFFSYVTPVMRLPRPAGREKVKKRTKNNLFGPSAEKSRHALTGGFGGRLAEVLC